MRSVRVRRGARVGRPPRPFDRRRGAAMVFAALLAGCSGPAASGPDRVRVVEGAIGAEELLADQIARAREAGAVGLEVVGGEVLSEGDQIGGFVEIPTEACMLAIASPGESVSDVDLFVYADDGERLAADEAQTARAAALVCPPHPTRVFVVARAMRGSGLVALGVMQVAPSAADAVGRAVDVRGRPGEDTGKLGVWPGLERKIRERRAQLGSAWDDVRRVALPVDARAESALSLGIDDKRCLDVLVVPGDDLAGIDVQLVDAQGRVVARGSPPSRDRALVICSGLAQSLTLLVRPRGGSGVVAVVVARSPEGARSELAEEPTLVDVTALDDVTTALARARTRLSAFASVAEVFRAELSPGTAIGRTLSFDRGCTRLEVVGASPLGLFEASLWGSDGTLLATAPGGASAALFWCSAKQAEARLEILAAERGGPVAVVAGRADAPEAALAHPQAAARLLARLDEAIGPVGPAELAGLVTLSLAPDVRTPAELAVGEGCVEVVAAVAGPAQGVELRVESADDEEILRARGHGVVGRRICADQAPARLTLKPATRGVKALVARVPRR
jgi:hypothetical protein